MKKKIYFVVVLGICFSMLMNCSKPDLDPTGMELEGGVPFGKKQLSVTKVDAQTVAKNPRMQKTMQNIQGKRLAKMQSNGRTLENTGYFKLQMTDIVMVEKGGYTSYTFAVLREQDSGYMENIIVNLYADGTMKTYFVEYDFTEAEKMALINYGNIPSDPKSQAYLMDNLEDIFSNNSVLRFSPVYEELMCAEVTFTSEINACPNGHDYTNYQSANDGNGCSYYNDGSWNPLPPLIFTTTVTFYPCGGGSGNNGNPNNGIPSDIGSPGEGSPGGGTGTGNDSSPPDGNPADNNPPDDPNESSDPELVDNEDNVISVPVPPKEEPKTPHEKNCEKLKDLIDASKQNIIPVIEFLEGKLDDNTKNEWSATFVNTEIINPETQTVETIEYSNEYEEEGTPSGTYIQVGADCIGGIHLHPKSNGILGGLFSWLDLKTLLKAHQMASNSLKQNVTFMLVAPRPSNLDHYNLYSLRIENVNELLAKLNEDWDNDEMTGLSDEEKLKKINEEIGNGYLQNSGNLEKYFLERFAGYGISLYKGDPDTEYHEWDKLELQNNTVVKRPCN